MQLSEVSKTALTTLRCHALESARPRPLLHDPMAAYLLERLEALATTQEDRNILRRRISPALVNHIALRARKYDSLADRFIAERPSPTIVSLGCGFDTRYWRIQHDQCRYIELDLPEMVDLKRAVLGDKLCYEMIGCSVLDPSWIDRVCAAGCRDFLLMAEGLLMYLPRAAVIDLFGRLAASFSHSQIALEVVTDAYTRGFWKQLVMMKMRQETGSDAGSSYDFGIRNAAELETYAAGIKVIGEWSYVQDPDVRPRLLKYLAMSRTQWTVIASLN